MDCVIVRPFAFVGEHLANRYAITQFIEAAKAGRPLEVWGNGSTVRSYLYGEDLGKWLWSVLLNGDKDIAYDIGGIYPYTILEVAQLVASIIPTPIHIMNNNHVETEYIPNLDNIRKLGCKQTVDLEEAIRRVINA